MHRSTANRATFAGFTLVELLVAVLITAIIATLGYGALSQAVKEREQIARAQTRMLELQSSMRFLAQDLSQAVPRPVRDSNGSGEEPAFWVDARRDVLLRLTRGGWRNSAQLQRSQLQRVHYLLDNGDLIRLEWPVTDATQATVPRRRKLITELRGVRVRLMNRARQWQDSWPAATAVANSARTLRERPIAVEVVLETNDLGELRRVFEVPG